MALRTAPRPSPAAVASEREARKWAAMTLDSLRASRWQPGHTNDVGMQKLWSRFQAAEQMPSRFSEIGTREAGFGRDFAQSPGFASHRTRLRLRADQKEE